MPDSLEKLEQQQKELLGDFIYLIETINQADELLGIWVQVGNALLNKIQNPELENKERVKKLMEDLNSATHAFRERQKALIKRYGGTEVNIEDPAQSSSTDKAAAFLENLHIKPDHHG